MRSFFDQVANFDAVSLAALEQIYRRASATDPMPLSFNGWLLLQVILYLTSHPSQYSQTDLHNNPGPFIAWLEDRTIEPKL